MRLVPVRLRQRLAWLIVLLLILGVGPLYWYIDYTHARSLLEDRNRLMAERAQAVATVVSENLRERQREIVLLANSELLRDQPLDSPAVNAAIQRLQASYPYYSWIGLTNHQGVVEAASGDLLVGQNVSARPWFSKGLQGPFIGDLHEAVLLAKLLPNEDPAAGPIRFIDFTAPVLDAESKVKGVLASHAHWRWAEDTVDAIFPREQARGNIEIFLVNHQFDVVYPNEPDTPRTVPSGIAARAPAEDQPPAFRVWEDQIEYLDTLAEVPEVHPDHPLGWKVVARQSRKHALEEIRALQQVVLIVALIMLLTFSAIAWFLARQISRPLEQLAHTARRIQQGAEIRHFEVNSSTREINQLVEALRGMTSTLLSQRQALARTNQELEAKVAERTSALAQANRELSALIRHDTLTGLPNRRAIDERLHADFERWERLRTPYAVAVLDIDHFKRVNDTHGHAAGDEVLCYLAKCMRSQMRETDLCARQGGEEFLVVLAVQNLKEALSAAEKLRQHIAQATFPVVGHLTVSIGVAIAEVDDSHPEAIVQRADRHLYQAKQAGRNRIDPGIDSSL